MSKPIGIQLTYGQLRSQLQTAQLAWQPHSHVPDNRLVPQGALGGAPSARIPLSRPARVDVFALIAATPPHNALLLNDLVSRRIVTELPHHFLTRTAPAASGTGGSPTRSSAVDWRNRYGWNWITPVRDQDPCEHCWVFAATCVLESMVRIEHAVWSPRSEGDAVEALQSTCGQGGDPHAVWNWVYDNGQADFDCVAWPQPADRSGPYYNPAPGDTSSGSNVKPSLAEPADRSGHTARLATGSVTDLGDIEQQKCWIDSVGPLSVTITCYPDFGGVSNDTDVYAPLPNQISRGTHVITVVGYDDGKGAWLVKNSWGPGWGNQGFGWIKYGVTDIDTWAKSGLRGVNPDPWTKRRLHSGGLLESGNGSAHRNFELFVNKDGQVGHYWRDNGSPTLPWAFARYVSGSVASEVSAISSTWNRNFELAYRTTNGALHHFWFNQANGTWNDGGQFGPVNSVGTPGLVESSYGPTNFELVTATADHTMEHWWRGGGVWKQSGAFGTAIADAGPTLLQSSWGNLELVALTTAGTLQHWWRADGGTWDWASSATFGQGLSSPACFIQGQYGMTTPAGNGNFELCVATDAGTIEHWWRDNQSSAKSWARSATFATNIARVISLVEGSYGFNLEVIALRHDNQLQHFWRDGTGWHDGVLIGSV